MREKLTKFVLSSSLSTYLFSALSAILLTLSFPKFNISVFIFIALIPLFYIVRHFEYNTLKITKIGLIFGVLHFATLLYWIVYTLHKYGNIHWFLGIFILLLLSLYLSIYIVIFLFISSKINAFTEPTFIKAVLVATFFVATEYLRSTLLTGFPWGLIGYPLASFIYILQFADLFGIWGLSFLIILINYHLFYLLFFYQNYRQKSFLLDQVFFLTLYLFLIGYNLYSFDFWKKTLEQRLETKDLLYRVALLQGNIPQELKEAKEIEVSQKAYEKLLFLSLSERPQFIFFPETALPFYFAYDKKETLRFLSVLERVEDEAEWMPVIVFGTFRVASLPPYPKIHNSLLVWKGGELVDLYDKEKLVPFGEYVPLGEYLPFLRRISVVTDIIRPGSSKNLRVELEGKRVSFVPLICFESAFPQILVKRLSQEGEFVFIATNDAWFGKTSAPYQHFQKAVVRAVEGRRYVLQSANTGISGIIDPLGRVRAESLLEREEIVYGDIVLFTEKTFFVKIGYVFPILCLILTGMVIVWILLQRKGDLKSLMLTEFKKS